MQFSLGNSGYFRLNGESDFDSLVQRVTDPDKLQEWIHDAIGGVALEAAKAIRPVVYEPGFYNRRTGGLQNSIWSKADKKRKLVWLIGPTESGYNWIAKWIPGSPHFADHGSVNRDFLREGWKRYSAGKDLGDRIAKHIARKIEEEMR